MVSKNNIQSKSNHDYITVLYIKYKKVTANYQFCRNLFNNASTLDQFVAFDHVF